MRGELKKIPITHAASKSSVVFGFTAPPVTIRSVEAVLGWGIGVDTTRTPDVSSSFGLVLCM